MIKVISGDLSFMHGYLLICLLLFTSYSFVVYGLAGTFFTHVFVNLRQTAPARLFSIIAFILGFYLMGTVFFISDLSVSKRIVNNDPTSNYLPVIVISFLSVISIVYLLKNNVIKSITSKINLIDIMIIIVGFIFSMFIVFNYNSFVNYGFVDDKVIHLHDFSVKLFAAGGFPIGSLSNIGMQCALLVPTVYLPSNTNNIVYSSLFFGLITMIDIIYLPYIFSKEILGLDLYFSLLSSIMVVLFGAISIPLRNRYLGFIGLSTTFYHNDTQLFAVPVVMLSIFFLYIYYINSKNASIVGNNNYLTLSIIFLSISYFLKPFGYVALAPIITLMITLIIISKRKIIYRNIIDLFILFLPIITTLVYNLVFKYKTDMTCAISSPGFLYLHYYQNYYPLFMGSKTLTLGLIIVVSLLGLILPLIWGLFSVDVGIRNKAFIYQYMVPALIISLFFAFFVIETGDRIYDFNYAWGVALIGCSMMPFIALILSKMKNKIFKYTCLSIVFLHVLSGAYHLVYITLTGKF